MDWSTTYARYARVDSMKTTLSYVRDVIAVFIPTVMIL